MLHRTKKKVKPIISKINKENKLYRDEVRIRVHNRRTIRGACMICATSSWRPFTQQHGTSADVWVTSALFPKRDSTLGKCFSFFCFPWTFACPFFFHRKATAVWTDVVLAAPPTHHALTPLAARKTGFPAFSGPPVVERPLAAPSVSPAADDRFVGNFLVQMKSRQFRWPLVVVTTTYINAVATFTKVELVSQYALSGSRTRS